MLIRRLATTGKRTHAADTRSPLNATLCGLPAAPIAARDIASNVNCAKCAHAIRTEAAGLKELLAGYYE